MFFILLFSTVLFAQEAPKTKSAAADVRRNPSSDCPSCKISAEGNEAPTKDSFISDSLVQKLPCKTLTKENVLKNISPLAFATNRQISAQNWASGPLAQCWALALTQRRYFYMARFNVANAKKSLEKNVQKATDFLRADPQDFSPFELSENNLMESELLNNVYLGDGSTNFRKEIEQRQTERFYSLGNMDLIFGSRERSEGDNNETMARILESNKQGRMPLIILRAATTSQHVVLIKKITKVAEAHYTFEIYDSNNPYGNYKSLVYFKDGQFFAPGPLGLFFPQDSNSPVGVFLRDEDDMDQIQASLYSYYKKLCERAAAAKKGNKS